jgi:hypothetical protein
MRARRWWIYRESTTGRYLAGSLAEPEWVNLWGGALRFAAHEVRDACLEWWTPEAVGPWRAGYRCLSARVAACEGRAVRIQAWAEERWQDLSSSG